VLRDLLEPSSITWRNTQSVIVPILNQRLHGREEVLADRQECFANGSFSSNHREKYGRRVHVNERGQQLLDQIRAHRGYVLPMHEFLAEHHPEFLAGYDGMFTAAMSTDSPLPAKVRELIVMAVDMAVGVSPNVVRGHARRAIEHGATEAEVVAAIELTTLVFAGRPLSYGANALREDA
jgi:alkylhydroperoxidase/carboxymuconolactone decarboxylase family protein YurZ